MTTENIGLMKALGAKMGYLNHRQRVISQNIANADTPGYRPKDLTPMDFGSVLKKVEQGGRMSVKLEGSHSSHLGDPSSIGNSAKAKKHKDLYEVAPAGNAVILEQQLIKSNKTVIDYNMMTGIYQKQIGMMKTAITTAP
jgi:flagellar basal-body rod protein FlgB